MHDPSNRRAASKTWLVAAAALAGSPAPAQNQWVIDLAYSDPAGVINSPNDTVTVTLWAAFDPQWYAFAEGIFDITADDERDTGVWEDPHSLFKWIGDDGTILGESIVGVLTHQLFFPEAGIFPDDSNPIAVWQATWSTSDLHPRSVPVATTTASFRVYPIDGEGLSVDVHDQLTEGSGAIQIVPTPSAALVLCVALLSCRRRRLEH